MGGTREIPSDLALLNVQAAQHSACRLPYSWAGVWLDPSSHPGCRKSAAQPIRCYAHLKDKDSSQAEADSFSFTFNKTTSSRNSRNRDLARIRSLYSKLNPLHTFHALKPCYGEGSRSQVSGIARLTQTYWHTQLFPWFWFGVNFLCVVRHQVHTFIKALKISNKSRRWATCPALNFSNNDTNYRELCWRGLDN